MQKLVEIKRFTPVGEDERGVTAEFSLCRKQDNFMFLTRKKGSLSGNTYHEGKSSATHPKTFVLLSGQISFSYRKIGTEEKHTEIIASPAIIEVSPYVTHKVEVLTDSIFLECNSINDIQNDRIREEV